MDSPVASTAAILAPPAPTPSLTSHCSYARSPLWREWAKLEASDSARRGRLKPGKEHAGIILSLARQEFPDTSAYVDPEIVYRARKKHHAGLIVRSASYERVTELLDEYGRRFAEDFIAVLPPLERPE